MDELEQLRRENAELKAEVRVLKRRAVEDRHYGEKRLELAVSAATRGVPSSKLKEQIAELEQTVAEEHAMVDRVVVYLRKLNDPMEDEP